MTIRRRLDRITRKAPPAIVPEPASMRDHELIPLAGEIASAFGRLVANFREHFGKTPEEARLMAGDEDRELDRRALDKPPDQVSWSDLNQIARHDPALSLERWEEIKRAARDELRSGHRAAKVRQEYDSRCWARAREIALREEIAETLQPRTGLEWQLIDQMVGSQIEMWRWEEILQAYTQLSGMRRKPQRKGDTPEMPLQSDADAMEQAVRMIERFHRLYLNTLQALIRNRGRVRLSVHHAGQINFANQQINLNT